MEENSVDGSDKVGYNRPQDDINDFVVKMDEQRPVNDIECKHTTLVPDPTDTIGDAVYHGCDNPKCGIGFYIRPK
jgi:hypothetical protein